MDSLAPVKLSDDCSPDQHLDHNLMRNLMPDHLLSHSHRNYAIMSVYITVKTPLLKRGGRTALQAGRNFNIKQSYEEWKRVFWDKDDALSDSGIVRGIKTLECLPPSNILERGLLVHANHFIDLKSTLPSFLFSSEKYIPGTSSNCVSLTHYVKVSYKYAHELNLTLSYGYKRLKQNKDI